MLNQIHCNSNKINFQPDLSKYIHLIKPLYLKYVPLFIRNRRNVHQSKLSDVLVISLLCFQVSLGITAQSRFYSYLKNNVFLSGELPERSRFNRICRNVLFSIQCIRNGLARDCASNPSYLIIDSLPLSLCAPIRNKRAKVFSEYADIGYNSSKKQYYYGFKGNFEIDNNGIIRAYTVTNASAHDINQVKALLEQYCYSKILADKGYLNRDLQEELKKQGIWLWTPVRKNMETTEAEEITNKLKRKRKLIETIFSKWGKLFDIERIRVQSLSGFHLRLEQCFLVYTIQLLEIN